MKKRFYLLQFLFLFVISTNLFAATNFFDQFNQPHYTWGDKLKRGALNIVTSPVEIARQISVTSKEQSLLTGWTLGLVGGLGQGILRFGAGVIDLVTFPFDFPDSKKAPLINPEYVWEKPGVKYS